MSLCPICLFGASKGLARCEEHNRCLCRRPECAECGPRMSGATSLAKSKIRARLTAAYGPAPAGKVYKV